MCHLAGVIAHLTKKTFRWSIAYNVFFFDKRGQTIRKMSHCSQKRSLSLLAITVVQTKMYAYYNSKTYS